MTPTVPLGVGPAHAPAADLVETLRSCRSAAIDGGKTLSRVREELIQRGNQGHADRILVAQYDMQGVVDFLSNLLADISGEATE